MLGALPRFWDIAAVVIVWLLLSNVVLPRLGIRT